MARKKTTTEGSRRKTAKAPTPRAGKPKTSRARRVKVQADPSPHDKIAKRAYQLYLERGGTDGHAAEDWARAEREILAGT